MCMSRARKVPRKNPVVRDKENITHVSYGNYHINTYIKQNNIAQDKRTVLKKYTETDCKLLCAIVTDAKGFVRQSVGDDVSEERVNVITAAYSLVGEVGYFWQVYYDRQGSELGKCREGFSSRKPEHRNDQSLWSGLQRLCYLGSHQWI